MFSLRMHLLVFIYPKTVRTRMTVSKSGIFISVFEQIKDQEICVVSSN